MDAGEPADSKPNAFGQQHVGDQPETGSQICHETNRFVLFSGK